jgi:hypothetical protein
MNFHNLILYAQQLIKMYLVKLEIKYKVFLGLGKAFILPKNKQADHNGRAV